MPRDRRKQARDYLTDMLDSARLAIGYLQGTTFEGFVEDTQLQDAVIRRIEVIGEAAKRVDDALRSEFTEMAWQEICGMRDVLIRQYDGIDYSIVFATVQDDLPAIVAAIESYFRQHQDTEPASTPHDHA